jgi:glycosidase
MMKRASLLQYTLPGVPSLYYGDEIGMQGMKDPFNRECMNWLEPNTELYQWYKRLGEIRKGCCAFVDGEFVPIYCQHKTIAFKRTNNVNEVLVAVNMDNKAVDINVGDEWNSSYSFFDTYPKNGTLHLEAYKSAIITRDNN